MGVVERREREKNFRRKQILRAAEKIFVAKGFAGATMEDIAQEAELSPATLYLYFRNKEELYTDLNLRILRYATARLEQLHKRSGLSPEQKLEALKKVFYNIYKLDPLSLINIFHFQASNGLKNLSPELLSEIQLLSAKSLRTIAKIFEEGIEQGVFIDRHPIALADVFWSTFSGIVLWEESKTKLNSRKTYLKKTLDLAFEVFLNSVKKK
jgi:AcrR family transcriptional regulator